MMMSVMSLIKTMKMLAIVGVLSGGAYAAHMCFKMFLDMSTIGSVGR